MNHASLSPRSPTVLRLSAPVAADGAVSATLRVLARAGRASLLVDAADVGSVLVRDPATGDLLRAGCTRHAYACGLTLHAHAAARCLARAAAARVAAVADTPEDTWRLQPKR